MFNIILKVLFFFIFILIITPLGIFLRSIGVDYLNRKLDKLCDSYWIKRGN